MLLDLRARKALVSGVANNRSIAWGIAQQLAAVGCDRGSTYLPEEKGRIEARGGFLGAPEPRPVAPPRPIVHPWCERNASQVDEGARLSGRS
jgi:enoyl-[acyl-carrier protein] reductase I